MSIRLFIAIIRFRRFLLGIVDIDMFTTGLTTTARREIGKQYVVLLCLVCCEVHDSV